MTCGCCVEACPQTGPNSKYVGPQIMAQVRLFNDHPTGKMKRGQRLRPLMEEGGIGDCGNAQNCGPACPKHVPLHDAIATVGWDVTVQSLRDLFSLPDRD